MDPGTALGVASLVYDITKDLYDYYRTWKDCEKDVGELRIQLLWLHKAFTEVRETVRNPELSDSGRDLVYNAMRDCNDAANELRDILNKFNSQASPQTALEKLKAQGRRACYPFKKSTVAAVAENVECCCEALHFAVNLLSLNTTTNITQKLQALDKKLTGGFDGIDTSLSNLKIEVGQLKETALDLKAVTAIETNSTALKLTCSWLSPTNYGLQLQDCRNRHTKGTGRWFLDSPDFITWTEGAKDTLYCHGHPGTGKTIMAALVIDHLLNTKYNAKTPVAYVFCNYKRQDEQTTAHFVGALLRQMIHAKGHVPRVVQELHDEHNKWNTSPSSDKLIELAISMTKDFRRLYIVIDALDECGSKTRRSVLSAIHRMQTPGNVKLLVTSRPLQEVRDELTTDLVLEIQASNADLALHLESRMDELSKRVRDRKDLQEKIVSAIVTVVSGVFLLADLHLDSLKGKRTPGSIISSIAELPTGSNAYDETYEKAMERIRCQPNGDRELAENALMWISCTRSPLTSVQLRHALAVKPSSQVPDEDDMELIEEVLLVCTGIVTEDEQSGVIRIVHYTAQDYLGRTRARWFPDADSTLALRCLWYLSFEDFRLGPCSSKEALKRRLGTYPLLEYAAKHWGFHYNDSRVDRGGRHRCELESKARKFILSRDLVLSSTQVRLVDNYHYYGSAYCCPPATGGLHVAAYFGVSSLVSYMLENGYDIEENDGYDCTPIWWAAQNGCDKVVRVLLDSGADVNAQGAQYGNALQVASLGGHAEVVRMLLDSDADANAEGGQHDNPLQAASYGDHAEVVRMLLDSGADVNAEVGWYGSTLQTASLEGHAEVVRMLLDSGADVNAQGEGYGNALQAASLEGHAEVVRMLLDSDADVKAQGGEYGNALQAASLEGHAEVVRMLLDSDADVNAQAGEYGNSLQAASRGGDTEVVRMLLDSGADVNAEAEWYGNALQAASLEGHAEVVRMLLDSDADVKAQGGEYGNALQAASLEGHAEVVRMLLDSDADVNAQGGEYGNSLQAASYRGYAEVVRTLLEEGADVNAQGGAYSNSLQAASSVGHAEVVRMLLDSGANVNAQGGKYGNALQAASYGGHAEVVRTLLEEGADVNTQGGKYGNAVQAAERGHADLEQTLRGKGAAVNAQGRYFGDALFQAACHAEVVRMLRAAGAVDKT